MNLAALTDLLWGHRARLRTLMICAVILLFTFLGGRDVWTQEHRWADIVSGMFFRRDFLHPYLGQTDYYDKPLLSYWLIALCAKAFGKLTTLSLRIPSALAGLLAVWSIYRLGFLIKDKQLGLLAGWMLLTTFYFLFWARISSADMLNLAGSLFAITWYYAHRSRADFKAYSIFFLIVAITSLCKGLVGAVVPVIAVAIDVSLQKSWREHCRWSLVFALLPAALVYFLPFWASSHFGGTHYAGNGLYLVYRENIMRYFQPFDHQGPIYTYLLFLPIYTLPWFCFFVPALWSLPQRFARQTPRMRWLTYTLAALFLFFTISGSRRSYYILPVVPFAILFTAEWIRSAPALSWRRLTAGASVPVMGILLFLSIDLFPAWYYGTYGLQHFASQVKHEAAGLAPWQTWQVVLLDADTKLYFYLHLPPNTLNYPALSALNSDAVTASWPILHNKPKNAIFITRSDYVALLKPYFLNYQTLVLTQPQALQKAKAFETVPVAFIPMTLPKSAV